MILRYYPTKDATLYERYPHKNTGLDAMLEISKEFDGDGSGSYNSRFLIDFDYAGISQNIQNMGYDPNKFHYNLRLYAAEAKEIPVNYNLYCYAISGSWDMGIGRYGNFPETTEGVSWYNKTTEPWSVGPFAPNVAGFWDIRPGGGNWYTSAATSQSFTYSTTDVDFDVTNIVRLVQSQSIDFNGFLIKKSNLDEISFDVFFSLKFFSRDTNTIYSPILEARYDDSVNSQTLDLIDTNEEFNIVPINLKSHYSEKSTPIIRFGARYRYPVETFTTSSVYLHRYRLPIGTQYAIYTATNDNIIVDFSEFTKVSDDSNSSYIKLHLDSFQPEKYYRLLLKVPHSGSSSTYEIYDEKWIFKVTRNQ